MNRAINRAADILMTAKAPLRKIVTIQLRFRGDLGFGGSLPLPKRFASTTSASKPITSTESQGTSAPSSSTTTSRPVNMRRHRFVYVPRAQRKKLHTSVNDEDDLSTLDLDFPTKLLVRQSTAKTATALDWLAAFPFK